MTGTRHRSSIQSSTQPIRVDDGVCLARVHAVEPPPERATLLGRLTDALEASPVPHLEWPRLRGVLGVDLLARLLGISTASVRRYASAARSTPDDVATRLHWLALVVGDLGGAYNEIGIHQWFERKRVHLDARPPAALLAGAWTPNDAGPRWVRDLAHALTGASGT